MEEAEEKNLQHTDAKQLSSIHFCPREVCPLEITPEKLQLKNKNSLSNIYQIFLPA